MRKSGRYLVSAGLVVAAMMANPFATEAQQSPHGALPETLTCQSCHGVTAWSPLRPDMSFDHAVDAAYPLAGRHADATCASCHEDLVFEESSEATDCRACHVDVHQGAVARPCSACHNTESFTDFPLGVVHPANFPLDGAHLVTSCESCHIDDLDGAFTPLEPECATCHFTEYVTAPLIDHAALGFSIDCTECHSTLDFRDVAFDHFQISGGFELTGRHTAIDCTSCHVGPGGAIPTNPAGPNDCYACHVEDYEDEHGGTGFPTDCTDCHVTDTWDDATFDHAEVAGGFELTGQHLTIDCASCHSGPGGTVPANPAGPNDCYACHVEDYDDEHSGTGFPTECTNCHTTDDWDGATFDHRFQIFNGPHAEEWNDCADCHTVPADITQFSCFGCHSQRDMDDKHSEERGYAYDSPTCLSCHPTGRS